MQACHTWKRQVGSRALRCAMVLSEKMEEQSPLSYGHAGAIELFAWDYHIPPPICTHNNYLLWAMSEPTPQILIAIGSSRKEPEGLYEEVEYAAAIQGTYRMSWRRKLPVYIARDPKFELWKVWANHKNFG